MIWIWNIALVLAQNSLTLIIKTEGDQNEKQSNQIHDAKS